jgi:superfamily II DNA or RNA helicase
MEATQEFAIHVPACISEEIKLDRNSARQVLKPACDAKVIESGATLRLECNSGESIETVRGPSSLEPGRYGLHATRAVRESPDRLTEPNALKWIGDRSSLSPEVVRESLNDSLRFKLADASSGGGLRTPQLGALHAVLGHWTIAEAKPATVVMPTGTGKTETMVALFAVAQIERLIIVVPSDALRAQIAEKFELLGVLQETGVIEATAERPVVGRVAHGFSSTGAAQEFARACNVVVTTPNALFASSTEVIEGFLAEFSHLFVDEAHHVVAATWRHTREQFEGRPVVQFTATPFREDGRQLGGRMVYNFPLRQAQAEGYFSKINYLAVSELDEADRVLAEKAIDVLRADLAAGRDHLLMARTKRKGRAREVHELYADLAPDLAPTLLYSSLGKGERDAAIAAIRRHEARIVVCVDMLKEGFDLPSLKVAAVHDPHKSLGVTLQFIGRFARAAIDEIGEATVVVGRPEGKYDENLRRLYAENADWNLLVNDLSAAAVGEQEQVSEFEEAFGQLPEEVSLRNLEPKMSTIVFRTQCEAWTPEAIEDLYEEGKIFTSPIAVNETNRVAWFVTESTSPVLWGDIETIADLTYHLYVLYWDTERQLLYINSSNKASTHDVLARAVCGEEATRIAGEDVFRAMARIQRLVPVNVGVLDTRNRSRRFSMHVGADVSEGFPVVEEQTKTKTNIFARGYEEGERVTIGAAVKKGRVWSYRVAPTLKHWIGWCDHVGAKLIDDGIDLGEVMGNFIRPESLDERPPLVALAAEWSWEVLLNTSEEMKLVYQGEEWPLIDAELRIVDFSESGPILFEVQSPMWQHVYEAEIKEGKTNYRARDGELKVLSRGGEEPLSDYLNEHSLSFFMEGDAMLVAPAILLKPPREIPAFDRESLGVLDWEGINIRKESQGPDRDADSIQAKVIAELIASGDWRVVIDDDGSGEIADIVAIRVQDEELVVRLVHCKYSSSDAPGARVADLYEVCGQAQKSARRRHNIQLFFHELIRRERTRSDRHGKTGLHGQAADLFALQDEARLLRPSFEISIAQPGLSKATASDAQLELLGATEVYLYESAYASFSVLCSP